MQGQKSPELLRAAGTLALVSLVVFGLHAREAQSSGSNSKPEKTNATLVVQVGHSSRDITAVAFSPDGRYALTASNDMTARLWELETGREIRTFEGHSHLLSSIAYSPDSKHMVTGSWDQTARVWEIETGKEVRRLEGHTNAVSSVAYTPDGSQILTGSWDKTVRLWSAETGIEQGRFEGHTDAITSVAIATDGKRILTGSNDKTARLWEIETGKEVRRFEGHSNYITSVAYSPDGKHVLTGSQDKTARLWNVETGKESLRYDGHSVAVNAVTFSPDGTLLLTTGNDWTSGLNHDEAKLWKITSIRELRNFRHSGMVLAARFSPDGKQVLTGGRDSTARLWNVASGEEVRRLQGSSNSVLCLTSSPDGKYLLTGGLDRMVRVWDLTTGKEVRILKGHTQWISALGFSPDGRHILSGSWDKTARVWDVETGVEVYRLEGHSDYVTAVSFSPDGRFAVTASNDRTARMWDVKTGVEVRKFEGHTEGLGAVAFSPDGRYVLTGSNDKTARIWEVETGRENRRFEKEIYLGGVTSVAYSPDGNRVLIGSGDEARLWEVATAKLIREFDGFSETVRSVSFSRDGTNVLIGTFGKAPRVLNTETGKEVLRLEGHSDLVNEVAFSHDGKHILTGGEDSSVRLWNASTGKELCQLISLRDGNWVVVDPDGRFDTNNLEEIDGLHWVIDDDPMRPLPLEIFMRDYFEPRLLPRALSGEKFREVRDISALNRLQPQVEIKSIVQQKNDPGLVTVTVEVSIDREAETGVYDVRLFREGRLPARITRSRQIVGQAPEPSDDSTAGDELHNWRQSSQTTLDQNGRQIVKFENIRLLRTFDVSEIEFSAYAFNEDRIKSLTDRKRFPIPKGLEVAWQGRAYIISVGVNRFEDPALNLQYAANDARSIQDVIARRLIQNKQHGEVVPIPLISDEKESLATKANLKTVLELLAGKKVDKSLIKAIPNAERLEEAKPEDMVVISFATHGYADGDGAFYLYPSDSGTGRINEKREKLISSVELSRWLRDVDAGEMVMIVDACHAAAAIEGSEFKPGPMGSRGLGQLSYDKGMRILTATQAANVAIEVGGSIGHGLLTYALVKEGLEQGAADFKPRDQAIHLKEWLEYGVDRVPSLYDEILTGRLRGINRAELVGSASGRRGYQQQPSLFDFSRKDREVVLTRISVSDSPQRKE